MSVMMQTLSSEHSPLVGDLQQPQGLCDRMDEDAFIPFTPEDFGILQVKRMMSFYGIVDKLAAMMIDELGASTKGLRATPQHFEYTLYLTYKGYGVAVKYSCKHWVNFAETRFWLTIKKIEDGEWVYAAEAKEKLGSLEHEVPRRLFFHEQWKELVIPLYSPVFADEDEVVLNLFGSVQGVCDYL